MVGITWAGRRSVGERRRAALDALVASGDAPRQTLPTFDLVYGSLVRQRFVDAALAAGHSEVGGDSWPSESLGLGDLPGVVFRDGDEAVVVAPSGTVALVSVNHGWAHVRVAAASQAEVASTCSAIRGLYPASYLTLDSDARVPITFWTLGRFGPDSRLRRIDAARWLDIEGNYSGGVRDEVGKLMDWREGPAVDGQLILWHGPPGTGKSWGLRALASEWAPWAEFHYITDPDNFFVADPSYMISVLLADSYATIDPHDGELVDEQNPLGKWRVLILEDTGELLAADAKDKTGQGLSRLLNVVDGMLGQGLKVLALITTNDPIEEMHPAVIRPGRCASKVEFDALSPSEATEWLGEPCAEGGTLAELYARRAAAQDAFPADDAVVAAGADPYADVLALAESPLPELEPGDYERYGHKPPADE